ncbi:MAG: chemotaxis-specific protein-glutamate methyltransferase CheB [Mariprofundaceae bacterium]
MIRVLIVDDSLVVAMLLKGMLDAEPDIEVVGHAHDGREGVRMAQKLKPDLITMDINMPHMDGFEATREIMATQPTPIVVVSASVDDEELQVTFRAIGAGALAVLEKPTGQSDPNFAKNRDELVDTVRAMSAVKVVRREKKARRLVESGEFSAGELKKSYSGALPARLSEREGEPFDLVAIGCSTGGPQALSEIVSKLPASFPAPIMVVQHISSGFMSGLVSWLDSIGPLSVKIAENGEKLLPGWIYMAPDGQHLLANRINGHLIASLNSAPPVGQFRPSATPLLQSVAKQCGAKAIGVMLSGMGSDGADGMKEMHDAKAHTFVQDEESSVVYGMPGSALKAGAVDMVVNLSEIGAYLTKLVKS